jgi:hypothetical protein
MRLTTDSEQLILNIPGGVVGAVSTILIGWLSDKWNDRSLVMIISILPTIAAFAMMIGLDPGKSNVTASRLPLDRYIRRLTRWFRRCSEKQGRSLICIIPRQLLHLGKLVTIPESRIETDMDESRRSCYCSCGMLQISAATQRR